LIFIYPSTPRQRATGRKGKEREKKKKGTKLPISFILLPIVDFTQSREVVRRRGKEEKKKKEGKRGKKGKCRVLLIFRFLSFKLLRRTVRYLESEKRGGEEGGKKERKKKKERGDHSSYLLFPLLFVVPGRLGGGKEREKKEKREEGKKV